MPSGEELPTPVTEFAPMTVAKLIRDLGCYPPDAIIKSLKATVDTGRILSTTTYSVAQARKLHALRASQEHTA